MPASVRMAMAVKNSDAPILNAWLVNSSSITLLASLASLTRAVLYATKDIMSQAC